MVRQITVNLDQSSTWKRNQVELSWCESRRQLKSSGLLWLSYYVNEASCGEGLQ